MAPNHPAPNGGAASPVPLAVVGSAIQLPGGISDRERFLEVIRDKVQVKIDMVGIGRYDAVDVEEGSENPWKLHSRWATCFSLDEFLNWDAAFFNVPSKLVRNMHPHQLAALHIAFEALEDAGIPLHEIHRTRTGVFVAGYVPFMPADEAPDETYLRGTIMSSLSDHVAYFLGVNGPSINMETACSSSLVALATAAASLQTGDCDTALVLGLQFFDQKDFHLSLQACGVLVQGPTCHPFDEDGAKGFLRAEGLGCLVLRRQPDAEAQGNRIQCLIRKAVAASAGPADSAMEGPGRVYEQPCPYGMREMWIRAYQSAGIPLKRLSYMECHATGTAVGDIIEVEAVGDVFGDSHDLEANPLRIASVKSNIGHAEIAAGMFSIIKVIQMLRNRTFLPTAGVTTPLKAFDWPGHNMRVQQEVEPFPEDAEPVIMGVNSFGIGGSYGHAILEEYRGPATGVVRPAAAPRLLLTADGGAADNSEVQMLALSAFSLPHLQLYAERLAAYLRERVAARQQGDEAAALLRDLCATLWCHRSRFMYRRGFLASAPLELAAQLEAFAKGGGDGVKAAGEGRKMQVAYVFTGQGSQYPGVGQALMRFPVYREAAQAVDRQFKALAGWSILDKLTTLSAAELKDTMYAQPASFLVQVGLFELLKFFGVFPDVVLGHSAGEVPAAYAAGLLTLEEAVHVVYHRSTEQQKMTGCGRLLVVAMGVDKARTLLEKHGYAGDVEVACVNSSESTVLAGSEARLLELKQSVVPASIATTFVEGNIAFHSSRMEPILPEMRVRLERVLGAKAAASTWSLPFVSTVTGRVESKVDAEYWCCNVREPVLFQKAIDGIFAGDTVPDVVLEIGPHQTLVSPIKQILNSSGKGAAVLPTLKKGAPCSVRFLEALGKLFELGVQMELKPYYHQRGYNLLESMPKHPFINKSIMELFPIRLLDKRNGQFEAGPVAGFKRLFDGAFVTEISDRTYKKMCDHIMGGKTLIPGSFFLEMALEAAGGLPITLTNVEYKSMLRIPMASKGELPVNTFLTMHEDEDGEAMRFSIGSCPVRDKLKERPPVVEHCSGRIVPESRQTLLETVEDPVTKAKTMRIRPGLVHGAFGHMAPLGLKDLGKEGIQRLVDAHEERDRFGSREKFYGNFCQEGMVEFREAFQLIEWVHFDRKGRTVLSKISYPYHEEWEARGGLFCPAFLDAVNQLGLVLVTDSTVYYAGGFEAAHFLRTPTTPYVYVQFIDDPNAINVGRRSKSGDMIGYDGNGNLLFYVQGNFSWKGATVDNYRICDLRWQQFEAVEADKAAAIPATEPQQQDDKAWPPEENERLTASLISGLQGTGALDAALAREAEAATASTNAPKGRKPVAAAAPSLARQMQDGIAAHNGGVGAIQAGSLAAPLPATLGPLARDFTSLEELVAALGAKVQSLPSPHLERKRREAEAAAAKAKEAGADEGLEGAKQQLDVDISAEDLREAVAVATFQHAEAVRVAERLKAMALAQAAAAGEPRKGGTSFVFRVLELAEECVETVLEALSYLDFGSAPVVIEYFLACSSSVLLPKLGTKLNRRTPNPNLRVRRVLFSEQVRVELKDIVFHALVLDDWVNSGAAAWQPDEEAGEQEEGGPQQQPAGEEAALLPPSAAAMQFLSRFLVPGAELYVRGLTELPLWAALASQVSPDPLPLAPMGAAAAQAEWEATLATYGGEPAERILLNAATPVLAGRFSRAAWEKAAVQAGGWVIALAPSVEDGRRLKASIQAQQPDSIVDVLVVGGEAGADLTDASTPDDYEQLLRGLFEPKAEQEVPRGGRRLLGFVFLAGVRDDSIMGEVAFGRLLRFCQALCRCPDTLKEVRASDIDASTLWVVTRGAFVGQIVPAQGTLDGWKGVVQTEVKHLQPKMVDLASLEDAELATLGRLVLADPPERYYAIEGGAVRVPRYHAIDKQAARSEQVSADDKAHNYVCEPVQGATPGRIEVAFKLEPARPPKDDEVTIEIHAAALNFRDVMISLGLLPEKSYEASFYGHNLGLEAAGVISAVGKDVTGFKVGDRVLCGEARCFANRLNAPARRVCPLEDPKTTFEDAASIQSVYNTSHHALVNLARVRKGERVLIHGGAGGIGHAAISIAKHLGAEIYATAGTDEKRQLVRDMGVKYVYNSRNTSWFEDLMRDTDNKGVHVVLNSLAGKHQRLGLQVLCSSGRFLEIGKVDIFNDSKLGLLAFRKNISFFAIDMDRLWLDDPELSAEVAREVGRHFEAGHYHRLPLKVFPMSEIREALEFMKTGKHVGKVIVTNYVTEEGFPAAAPAPSPEQDAEHEAPATVLKPVSVTVERPPAVFENDCTYLVTGGAGGFGSALIRYAYYERGCTNFLITTRSDNHAKVRTSMEDMLQDPKFKLTIVTADTGKEEDVKRLCNVARTMDPPVESIFHVAGISIDKMLHECTDETFQDVGGCKCKGAWWLHENTLDLPIRMFVCTSSIAALVGGLGMAAYSAANAYLDALMRYRRQLGLPAATFNMTSLSDVGILANNLKARKFHMKVGMEFISSKTAVQQLEAGLTGGMGQVTTLFFKPEGRDMFPCQSPFSHNLQDTIALGMAKSGSTQQMTAKEIAEFIAEEVRSITGSTDVLVTSGLTTLGLDSLGIVELGGRLKKAFGVELEALKLSAETTITDIAKVIYKLQTSSTAVQGGEAGAEAEEGESLDTPVFHTKAEMNHMIASTFAPATAKQEEGAALAAAGTGRGRGSKAILLYGADSIQGSHILRYLLKGTRRGGLPGAPVVYCLGSWQSVEGGLARIEKAMQELRIWKPAFAARIVPLAGGDVTQARFKLPAAEYARLVAEVGTVVHAGSALLWALDAPLVAENVSALMNMVALARANGASVHYVSSQWLDGYDGADPETDDRRLLGALPEIQVKRRAEEILHFAAHQHGLRCAAYRLPCLSVNTKGGFSRRYAREESFVVKTMAILRDAGLLVAGSAEDLVPLISADVAGKFVAGRVLRSHGAHGGSGRRRAAVHSPTLETELVTMATLVDWIEEAEAAAGDAQQQRINREGTREEMLAYFERTVRLPPMVESLDALFFKVVPVLSRTTRRLVAQARRSVSPLQYTLLQAKRRGQELVGSGKGERVSAMEGMRRYLVADPSLLSNTGLAVPGGADIGVAVPGQEEEVEAPGTKDVSTASEGSTSESEEDEASGTALAKATAKAAAVAGGGVGAPEKEALTLSQ